MDETGLAGLWVSFTDHDKLPDMVLRDPERNWLSSAGTIIPYGPMTPKRIVELEEMVPTCSAAAVYVSAFPDCGEFRLAAACTISGETIRSPGIGVCVVMG